MAEKGKVSSEKLQIIVIPVLACMTIIFLLIQFANSKIGYDTGLYHLQKVQWLTEYGHVPGLTNLDGRLGFYSIYFYVAALVRYLSGSYVSSLYLNLLFSIVFVVWIMMKSIRTSDFKYRFLYLFSLMGLLFYIGILKSLYQDVGGFIVIQLTFLWLIEKIDEQREISVYKLIFLLSVIVSIKFSYIFLLVAIFFLIPIILKTKPKREAWFYISGTFFLAFLTIYHNYWLSGWLIYPFPALDLFEADWKVPAYLAANQQIVTGAFAKAPGSIEHVLEVSKMSLGEWFPLWAKNNANSLWLLYVMGISIFANLLLIMTRFRTQRAFWSVDAVLLICFFSWFFTAPSIRFGFIWLFLSFTFTLFLLLKYFGNSFRNRHLQTALICFLSLTIFTIYFKKTQLFSYFRHGYPDLSFSLSVDIPKIALKKVMVPNTDESEFIYVPVKGEQTFSADKQPIASRLFQDSILPFINDIPRMRTGLLKDGFYTDTSQTIRAEKQR